MPCLAKKMKHYTAITHTNLSTCSTRDKFDETGSAKQPKDVDQQCQPRCSSLYISTLPVNCIIGRSLNPITSKMLPIKRNAKDDAEFRQI
jgi:hypothetical protein